MEFKHPKYYAALRAEKRKLQAASLKHQALKAPSSKLQAPSSKLQAPSRKLQAPWFVNHETFENDSRILDQGPRPR